MLTCVNSWQKLAPVNLAWTPRRFSARSHGPGYEPKSGWEFRLQSTETRVKRQGLYRCYRCLTYICLFAKTNEQQKSELFGSSLSQTRKEYTCYTEMGSRWLPQKNASGKTLMRHFACSTLEVYGSLTWVTQGLCNARNTLYHAQQQKTLRKAPLEMLYPDTGMISIQIYTLSNERTLIYTSCSALFRKISINFVSMSLSEQVHKLTSCSKLSRASQDF